LIDEFVGIGFLGVFSSTDSLSGDPVKPETKDAASQPSRKALAAETQVEMVLEEKENRENVGTSQSAAATPAAEGLSVA
jgi:hypothetical protein